MTDGRVTVLLDKLGVDEVSFDRLIEWVLCDRRVYELVKVKSAYGRPDKRVAGG